MKLKVEELTKSFDQKLIFENLSFQVKENEFISILGSSGSGKSTILNILSGTIDKDHGKVLVDEEEVSAYSEHFAYMPQLDLLFDWKTVLDNVCLAQSLKGNDVREEASIKLKEFGLDGYQDAYPSSLSGGMRQRAAFLRTMLCDADILLLDEPFGALDVITREEMQDWLASIRTTMNKTIVLVTHDIDEAIYLSDRILLLSDSPARIIEEIEITEEHRSREWLLGETKRRLDVRAKLKR